MRLFFAVQFTDLVKDALQEAIARAAIANPPWRWVVRGNFHITLKFLGETPEDQIGPLTDCVVSACRDIEAFDISLGGFGGFPSLRRPRVLFYKVEEGAKPLRHLAERVDAALFDGFSIPKERRAFRAHATVARVKSAVPRAIIESLGNAPAARDASQTVDTVCLLRSQLGREGAKYHRVKEIALAKSTC